MAAQGFPLSDDADATRRAPAQRARRAWYRLHLLTLLVAGLLAGLLAWCNLHNIDPYGETVSLSVAPPLGFNPKQVHVMPMGNFTITLEGFTRGWPLRFRDYCVRTIALAPPSKQPPQSEKTVLLDSPRALAVNVLVGLGIVLCVGVLVERWLRVGRWGQFGLRGLLVATAVVAFFLSIWRIHGRLETAFGQENLITRVFEFPAWAYVPLLIGVTCAVYAVFSLAAWIVFGMVGLALKAASGRMTSIEAQITAHE